MPFKLNENRDKHFIETYPAYKTYFHSIIERYSNDTGIANILHSHSISLEQIYITQTLIEPRTQQELHEEQEVAATLKILEDKKVALEIEGFIKRIPSIIADSAISNYHRLVVIGKPGTGKTTLLKHLALTHCQNNIQKQERGTIPILLPLGLLATAGEKSIYEGLNDLLHSYFPLDTGSSIAEEVLGSGPCVLLLDDFEQLASAQNQHRIVLELVQLAHRYPACKIIVTAMETCCLDQLINFHKLELWGFNEKQVKQFLHKWFNRSAPTDVSVITNQIDRNPHLRRLAGNPLMMTMIAIIYETEGALPVRRTELYQRLTQVVMQQWQNQKNPTRKYTTAQKELVLRKLAFENYCQNRSTFTVEMVLNVCNRYPNTLPAEEQDARQFIEAILQHSYLLIQINPDNHEFFHSGWLEYFTALELMSLDNTSAFILTNLNNPRWQEPILFCIGMMADATPLIQGILNQINDENFYQSYILAGKCIAAAQFCEPDLTKKITTELWSLYQDDVILENFGSPMDVLAEIKPEPFIQEMIQLLLDKDHKVRSHAAYVLESLGGESAIPALIQVLARDKSSYTRGVAAATLGSIGTAEQIIPALILAFQKSKNRYVRAGAIEAFRVLGSVTAIPTLLFALQNDKNDYVRSSAADALGAIAKTDVIPAIALALTQDTSIDVRMSAADALGSMGCLTTLPTLTHALHHDQEWQVRVRVVNGIEGLGSADAIPALTHSLKHDKDWKVRVNIVRVLCMMGCEAAIPALTEALKEDNHGFVRFRAAKALGKIGNATTIPILKKALTVKGTGVDKFIRKVTQQSIDNIRLRLGETTCGHPNGNL